MISYSTNSSFQKTTQATKYMTKPLVLHSHSEYLAICLSQFFLFCFLALQDRVLWLSWNSFCRLASKITDNLPASSSWVLVLKACAATTTQLLSLIYILLEVLNLQSIYLEWIFQKRMKLWFASYTFFQFNKSQLVLLSRLGKRRGFLQMCDCHYDTYWHPPAETPLGQPQYSVQVIPFPIRSHSRP